jgi:outer membrane receptor for ferrienterochelin and colicin
MKKLLGIMVLGLLLSGATNSAESMHSNSSKYVEDIVSNLTVAKIIKQAPASLQEITTNEDGVQYHFFMSMKNVVGKIPVICFINSKSTVCRVP